MNWLKLILFNHLLMEEAGDKGGGGGGDPILTGDKGGAGDKGGGKEGEGDKGGKSDPPPADFKLPDNWRDTLPQDLKDEPALKTVHDFNALVKSFVHAQKTIGADKVVIPGKNATPDDWNMFFQKVGVPKDSKDFKIELPKDATFDNEFVDSFRDAAHKANLLPNQAQALVNWFNEANSKKMALMSTDQKVENQKQLDSLKAEWGEAFQAKTQQANLALSHFDPKGEIVKALKQAGLQSNATMIRFLASVGEGLKEDGFAGEGGEPPLTPKEATSQLNAIFGNMAHPYFQKDHPGHKAAVDEVQKLMRYKNPS